MPLFHISTVFIISDESCHFYTIPRQKQKIEKKIKKKKKKLKKNFFYCKDDFFFIVEKKFFL